MNKRAEYQIGFIQACRARGVDPVKLAQAAAPVVPTTPPPQRLTEANDPDPRVRAIREFQPGKGFSPGASGSIADTTSVIQDQWNAVVGHGQSGANRITGWFGRKPYQQEALRDKLLAAQRETSLANLARQDKELDALDSSKPVRPLADYYAAHGGGDPRVSGESVALEQRLGPKLSPAGQAAWAAEGYKVAPNGRSIMPPGFANWGRGTMTPGMSMMGEPLNGPPPVIALNRYGAAPGPNTPVSALPTTPRQ